MSEIAGFWSYVHDDNDSVDGAVTRLAERVVSIFELLSGQPLKLFIDGDLEWGEAWKERIDRELQETTFFIPIITPRYFQSEECRRELVKTKTAVERFEVSQLLLPIYYVTVPEMEVDNPEDELMAFVKEAQREDMREVRLAEESDAVHRKLVDGLAGRLLRISRETEGLPAPPREPERQSSTDSSGAAIESPIVVQRTPSDPDHIEPQIQSSAKPGQPLGSFSREGDEATGSLEKLAAGEEALVAWSETVQELSKEISAIGTFAEEETPAMEAADTFAGQLAVANRLALKLEEPAENIARIGQDYSTHLLVVDPAVQTLIENARTSPEVKEEEETKDLFQGILSMTGSARKTAAQLMDLVKNMEAAAQVSRELRRPVRRIQTTLRNITDGQKILDDWEAQVTDLYGGELEPRPEDVEE
jgi:hypothetical protein